MTPTTIKGVEFEALCAESAARDEKAGILTMGRYGVTMSVQDGRTMGISSLPDFEGVLAPIGRQFIMENKVCSGPSFPMQKDKIKPRQVSHMLKRSKFGAISFLVIHFNARNLIKSSHAAFTVAIPVTDADPRWQRFVDAYALAQKTKQPVIPQGSISRDEAEFIGLPVRWEIAKGCRKSRPNLLSFLRPELMEPLPEPEPEEIMLAPSPELPWH
jgi:hypothetical protein